MDWSVLACGRGGHVTYAPDEPELRRRLSARTELGRAWRCLRCGGFVLGEPRGEGPAEHAPIVLRGKQLRDALILRLFAVEKALRAVLLIVLAYAVWRFSLARGSLQRLFDDELPLLQPVADRLHYDLEHSRLVHAMRAALSADPAKLRWIVLGLSAVALLSVAEAIGLWMLRRWGEYVAVIATSLGLPLEIYELSHKVTVLRVIVLVLNLLLLGYLLYSKRLFGLRGGHAAMEAERREVSLLEVEESAITPGHGRSPGRPGSRRPATG